MQALPTRQASDLAASPFTTFLVRDRIWIYLALLLSAIALIALDRRANSPTTHTDVSANTAQPMEGIMARTMQEVPKKRMSTAKRVAKSGLEGVQAPTHDEIAQRARELFEESGYPSDRDLEFWLKAERELREVLKA